MTKGGKRKTFRHLFHVYRIVERFPGIFSSVAEFFELPEGEQRRMLAFNAIREEMDADKFLSLMQVMGAKSAAGR